LPVTNTLAYLSVARKKSFTTSALGGKTDPHHPDVVVHDEDENDADSGKVPLHLQPEGPFPDLARHDRYHPYRRQPRGRPSTPLET
jgi:hypothetical protein